MKTSAFFLIVAWSATLVGASLPFWDGLSPGPYTAGFAARWIVDETRSWRTEAPRVPSGRPVRVSIWYPAYDGGKAMTFADYVQPRMSSSFADIDARLAAANLRLFEHVLRTAGESQRLLSAPIAARYGARAVNGRFPVVVYSAGWNEVWQHANFVLAEYLATHGYVVVTVPQLPRTDADRLLDIDAKSIDTQVRDLEIALAVAVKRPDADAARVATMGHSMGGVAALILAMRQPGTKAVVGLDASYAVEQFAHFVTGLPDYNARTYTAPLLDLRRDEQTTTEVLDELRYAHRYLYTFGGVQHADFTSFPQVALLYETDIEGRTPVAASRVYTECVKTTLAFLDAVLVHGAEFEAPAGVRVRIVRAARRPPDETTWAHLIEQNGIERALQLLAEHPEDVAAVNEQRLNSIGYAYLAERRFGTAVDVLRFNAQAHPQSANALDSLAEAYLKSGKPADARSIYERVLEALQNDPSLKPEQKSALEHNAREMLSKLRP